MVDVADTAIKVGLVELRLAGLHRIDQVLSRISSEYPLWSIRLKPNLAVLDQCRALCFSKYRLGAADFRQPEHHDREQDNDDVHWLLDQLWQSTEPVCGHHCIGSVKFEFIIKSTGKHLQRRQRADESAVQQWVIMRGHA